MQTLSKYGPTHLEHEHGQFLVVLPLFHCSFDLCRRSGQRRPAALAGRLSVKLRHLLQLLPQVFSNYLSPFYRSHIKPVRHCSTKPNYTAQQQRTSYLLSRIKRGQFLYENTEWCTFTTLTYAGVNDMPLLHLGFSNGSVIRTCHFNHPCRSHHRHRVLGKVAKHFLFLAEDRNLAHTHSN